MTPDLSIIIVTYNSESHIASCLSSLPGALESLSAEVIVVDNDSRDGTAALVRRQFPDVHVIESGSNLGFAAGINTGLAVASGRYAVWINPDSRVVGGQFADVVAWLDRHPSVGIAGLRLVDGDGTTEPSHRGFPGFHSAFGHRYSLLTRVWPGNPFSRRYLRTDTNSEIVLTADWVSGAALVHRRDVSTALGGLDTQFFMYCEDVDFCFRATQAGHGVRYLPFVTLQHEIGGSSSGSKRAMIRARHDSLWTYYKKHLKGHPVKDALAYAGIFTRSRWLLLCDALGARRVK